MRATRAGRSPTRELRRWAAPYQVVIVADVPAGVIVMWAGALASVPTGWALCNGLNGTPDLRDLFIKGWTEGQQPGQTGGTATHTHDDHAALVHSGAAVAAHPAHTHAYTEVLNHTHVVSINDPGHNHTQNAHTHTLPVGATDDTSAPFDRADAGTNASGANATTSVGSTTATNIAATTGITASTVNPVGGVASGTTGAPSAALTHAVTQPDDHGVLVHSASTHEPPYYSIAFIMKV